MDHRILPIALLLSLNLVVSVVGQTQTLPSAYYVETDQAATADVIHIPSPFTGLYARTYIQGVPIENQPRAFRQVQDKEETLDDAIGSKKFVIESWTLGVDGPSAEAILQLVDASTLQVDDDVITTGTISSLAENSGNADGIDDKGTMETRSSTTYGKITESQFSQIRHILGSSIENNASSAPKSIVFENQQATISDAAAVPFMVATRPGPDGQGDRKSACRDRV